MALQLRRNTPLKAQATVILMTVFMISIQSFVGLIHMTPVFADSAGISTVEELKSAFSDPSVNTIILSDDIVTSEKLVLNHKADVYGNGHTISFIGDQTGWQGNYVLQVYNTGGVMLESLNLKGGDAGLLVNGSNVTLTGSKMDVSGNEFGGIEVSKGVGVVSSPLLTINTLLINVTEAYKTPTVWEDKINGTVTDNSRVKLTKNSTINSTQVQYYLVAANASKFVYINNFDELKRALSDNEVGTIVISADIASSETLIIAHSVTIIGNGHEIALSGDKPGWQGRYVLSTYDADIVTLNNIKLSGGDAGLLVSGSYVTISGPLDVSGNEFGGIEVSKGLNVTTNPSLTINAALTNETEILGVPTVWEDGVTGTVHRGSFTQNSTLKIGQVQYYLVASNATGPIVFVPAPPEGEKVKDSIAVIERDDDFSLVKSIATSSPLPNGVTILADILAGNNPIDTGSTQDPTERQAAVLGIQTAKDNGYTSGAPVNTAAIAPSAEGWKFFGLAWYWWIVVLAAIASILYAMARRHNQDA